MAALTVDGVLDRIRTAVAALEGWQESGIPYDLFGTSMAEGSYFAHLSFAIGAPETVWDSPIESSLPKRRIDGGLVETGVGVRWMHRVRVDDAVADYAEMFQAEARLYKAIVGCRVSDLHVFLDRMQRRIVSVQAGDWVVCEIRMKASHRLALE